MGVNLENYLYFVGYKNDMCVRKIWKICKSTNENNQRRLSF